MNLADFIFSNAFIIMFFPIWVAFLITLNFTVPSFRSKHFTINLTLISTGICAIYSLLLLYVTSKTGTSINYDVIPWFRVGQLYFNFGFLLDNLSALFLVIFTVISFFIQLYSYGYMKNDEYFHRYFVYLNIINFSFSGFLISTNLFQSYIFIVLTGICTYLLTGFWYKKKSASDVSQKLFIVNTFADSSILLGIIFLIYFAYYYYSSTDYSTLNFSQLYDLGQAIIPLFSEWGFGIICGFIVLGLLIKSAQFPFHKWLIDTKEAPITATAVIGSATIVFLGVYLTIRLLPLFNMAPIIKILLVFGLVSSLLCSILSAFQYQIDKIILYIISSQIGLIFAVLSIFSTTSALIQTTVVSFSSALLFLMTGIIIATFKNSSDIREMGGIRKVYPSLALIFGICVLSLSGLFFSGLVSKIQVLDEFIKNRLFVEYAILLLSSAIVSFSCFRAYFLIFEGENSKNIQKCEFQLPIKISLWTLLVPVIFVGFFAMNFFNNLFNPLMKGSVSLKGSILFISVNLIILLTVFILYKFNLLSKTFNQSVIKFIENSYDKIIDFLKKTIFVPICNLFSFIDSFLIKGIEKFICLITKSSAVIISKLHTGNIQSYLLQAFWGIILTVLFITFYYYKIKGF